MAKPLVSLGIAATAFYAPVVPLAMYLVYRNWWRPPKLAWYPLFSHHSVSTERIHYPYANTYEIDLANKYPAVRLASGPVLIALANNIANEGLYIAATFLLNVGVIPLLLVNFGFVLIVQEICLQQDGNTESARVYISVLLTCSQDHRQHQRPGSGQALQ